MWTEYQLKRDEVYMNSVDFVYCVKCFMHNKRLEIWRKQEGYYLFFADDTTMFYQLDAMREMDGYDIEKFIKKEMIKVDR